MFEAILGGISEVIAVGIFNEYLGETFKEITREIPKKIHLKIDEGYSKESR